ncbi:MAG TPA: hypothetical protein VMJ30_01835, partial [Gemmatimonadales bacterium]|nr:hypothetical protein [Gemmatimonadales bacterium]
LAGCLPHVAHAAPAMNMNTPEQVHAMSAMLRSMVILMIPSFLICTTVLIVAYRKRNKSVED